MEAESDFQRLTSRLQRLEDLEEIKRLRGLYARCVDTKDWDTWKTEVLTEDYRLESHGGVQEGRDQVVSSVSKGLDGATTAHHCHTPEIVFTDADHAKGIWAMQDHVSLPAGGQPIRFRGAGHYHDEYVRTSEGWRIRSTVQIRLSFDVLEGQLPERPSGE
jgi:SnoaL-like domain